MTARESLMISYYKNKITELQHSQKYYEGIGKAGMCLKIQGKIEAFNAVISDLINERNFSK